MAVKVHTHTLAFYSITGVIFYKMFTGQYFLCCLFWPANSCFACYSLVEINFFGIFTSIFCDCLGWKKMENRVKSCVTHPLAGWNTQHIFDVTQILPFYCKHIASLPSITQIVQKHYKNMIKDPSAKRTFPNPPMIAYRQPPNLRRTHLLTHLLCLKSSNQFIIFIIHKIKSEEATSMWWNILSSF